METRTKLSLLAILMVATALVGSVMAAAAQPSAAPTQGPSALQSASPPPGGITPLARKLLTQACQTLGSADAFTFHAEVLFDQALPAGVKVQYAGAIDFAVQRPNQLAIDYQSDLGAKRLWYQHNTLTIFDPLHAVYATLTVPDSIDDMLEQVARENHLTLPLSDLAYTDPCQRILKQTIYGDYIGVNDAQGVPCDHVAFSTRTVDLQLWLDRSGKPVPRKIVINYRAEPSSPEYIAFLSDWKFPREIAASQFAPELPKDAKKIEFLKIEEKQP